MKTTNKSASREDHLEAKLVAAQIALLTKTERLGSCESNCKRVEREFLDLQSNFAAFRKEFERLSIQNGNQYKLLNEIDSMTTAMCSNLGVALPDKDLKYRLAKLFLGFMVALRDQKSPPISICEK